MAGLLIAVIYLAFVSLGLPDSLLGAAWPVMHGEMGVPVSYMGMISMVIAGCTIISSLLSNALINKLGTRWVTVISVFMTAAALFGFSFSNKLWMLIIFSVPYGLGSGAIDAGLNNYVALHFRSRQMVWLHCFWGVGAIISPFVMSHALTHAVWNEGYRLIGYVQLAIGVILLISLPLWKKAGTSAAEDKPKKLRLVQIFKIKGAPLIMLAFFAYCAAEATAMYWASTYFAEAKHLASELAAKFASLFYIGMTAGRLLSGFISDKLGDKNMILSGTVVLSVGIILLFVPSSSYALSLAGFLILGLGCAPIYPCIVHSAPVNFGAENSGAIIGVQMAFAYVGNTFMPPLFGLIASRVGFEIMPLYLVIFFAIMLVLVLLCFKTTGKYRFALTPAPEYAHTTRPCAACEASSTTAAEALSPQNDKMTALSSQNDTSSADIDTIRQKVL